MFTRRGHGGFLISAIKDRHRIACKFGHWSLHISLTEDHWGISSSERLSTFYAKYLDKNVDSIENPLCVSACVVWLLFVKFKP